METACGPIEMAEELWRRPVGRLKWGKSYEEGPAAL